ncbi:MAG: glycosyltransferase [Candidatus Thalassarchaeaceae archaeon]
MNESDGAWMLSEATRNMIRSRIPSGGTILEFGSGEGTNLLSGEFRVTAIEHDKDFLEIGDFRTIHAPIVHNSTSERAGEFGWYNAEIIRDEIDQRYDLIIIDGPTGTIGRSGILEHTDLLQKSGAILVDDVQRIAEHNLALELASRLHGTITIHRNHEESWRTEGIRSWAWIEPNIPVDAPPELPYPDVSRLLPDGMILESPKGLANDHSFITDEVENRRAEWQPYIPVSIVIPLYNRKEMLGKTLACLAQQTYPVDLMEIIIADDGSQDKPLDVIDQFRDELSVRYVHQEDNGYRLAEIRNLGIRSAKNEHVILLDCDMAPVPTMVETYLRYLEVNQDVVLCGHRRYVDANQLSIEDVRSDIGAILALPDIETMNEQVKGNQAGQTLDWRIPIYLQSHDLRFEKYPFRAVCGGNIGFHRDIMETAGWFDEEFTAWGAEDTEWGFRAWNHGLYIIPLIQACGLHQEPPGGRNETDREAGKAITHPMLIDRCPVVYRRQNHSGPHSTPLVSIYMPAFNSEGTIVPAVQSALNQTVGDLEICIVDDGSTDGTYGLLLETFGDDPRVRIKRQENGGIGSASNAAIRMCRGVYIGQLDSDDLLQPFAVEILLNRIQRETRLGVIYGSYQRMDEMGRIISDGYVWPDGFSREKLLNSMMIHHFRLFRARDWWRTSGFAEDLTNAVDYDMFLKLSEVTEFEHLHKWSYLYRMHNKSTSIKESWVQDRNNRIVIERALKRRNLNTDWKIVQTDPDNPRRISFFPKNEEVSEQDAKNTPEERVEKETIKSLNIPTNIGLQPVEHRIEIGPITDIFRFNRLSRSIARIAPGLSLGLSCSKTGVKARFNLLSKPLKEIEASGIANILAAQFTDFSIRHVQTHHESFAEESVPTGNVTRIRIGHTRSIDEILRIKKRVKRIRRTWKVYVEARTLGPDPILSIVTGRLESKHADEQVEVLRLKMPEILIEVDHNAQN